MNLCIKRVRPFALPLFLFFLFLLPFIKMFSVRYVDGYDFLLHFHMIYTLEAYIQKGILLPRFLPAATYGYGSPILTYMWAIPYYLGVVIHMLGVSYENVFKVLIIFPTILSGFGMYWWIKSIYGRFAGVVAAIVYVWAPYRFVNSFKRGDIGELFFFGIFPFIMYYLSHAQIRKNQLLGIIFCALLIYSHQGMSLVGYMIFCLFVLYQYYSGRKLVVLYKQFSILIGGLILSAFFWVPAVAYHGLLPFGNSIGTEWFPPLLSLVRSKWEGGMFEGRWLIHSYQIGLAQLLIIIAAHLLFINLSYKHRKGKGEIGFWLIIFWISIFFLQPISYWTWLHIPFFAYLQFPYRLLFVSMLCSSVLVGILLHAIKGYAKYMLGILIIILALYSNRNHLGVLEKQINWNEFVAYRGTYDVGGEKLPYFVNLKQIEKEIKAGESEKEFIITKGKGNVVEQVREDYASFAVIDMDTAGRVKIRRIYFPGWNISVNNKRISENMIIKGNGIFLPVSKGTNTLQLSYRDPWLVVISEIISLSFFITLFIWFKVLY